MYLSVKSFERSSTLAVAKEAIFFINNRIWRMIVGKPHVYVIFTPAVNYFCWFFLYFDYNWRGPKPGPNQITATIKGSTGVWMFMYNQFCWK